MNDVPRYNFLDEVLFLITFYHVKYVFIEKSLIKWVLKSI